MLEGTKASDLEQHARQMKPSVTLRPVHQLSNLNSAHIHRPSGLLGQATGEPPPLTPLWHPVIPEWLCCLPGALA